MASDAPVFDRLTGLETEYAIRFRPREASAAPPAKFELYRALVEVLSRRSPTARARHFKEGVFTANGGAVWFEAERPAAGAGLIEGATPECRGPKELLCYQRAQDRMLAESAESAETDGLFRLIKNDRDSRGNVYGAQENYEAEFASGWRLALWRFGLVALLPLLLATWLGFLLLLAITILYLAIAALLYLAIRRLVQDPRRAAARLFGRDLAEGKETGGPTPVWLESTALWAMRLITGPLAAAFFVLCWLTAFHRIRRQLLPLLVSRSVLCGSGMLDAEGRFHLADKAPAVNCVSGFGGFLRDRPIFTMGHLLKALCMESILSPRSYLSLFAARQRLQIGLGDCNMAQTAELLRVGTTLLALDAIEAGAMRDIPRVRRPLRALHVFCADPTLAATFELAGGGDCTALELQRLYLDACRRFVERSAEASGEAREVLRLWDEALEHLEQLRRDGSPPPWLIGRIDWVTKKVLLDRAGRGASWAERKKIDLRYHELSSEGYFQALEEAGGAPRLVADEEIARAMRNAPPNSPATMRGRFIREFAQCGQPLSVNWTSVVIGRALQSKVIRLARYGRGERGRVKPRLRGRA